MGRVAVLDGEWDKLVAKGREFIARELDERTLLLWDKVTKRLWQVACGIGRKNQAVEYLEEFLHQDGYEGFLFYFEENTEQEIEADFKLYISAVEA